MSFHDNVSAIVQDIKGLLSQFFRYWFVLTILATVILILTFPKLPTPFSTGLDESYELAYNYAFVNKLQVGKDLVLTFGPLGFLLMAKPIQNNVLIAVIFFSILKFIFIFLCLYLVSSKWENASFFRKLFDMLIILLFSFMTHKGFLLIVLPTVSCIYYKRTKNVFFLILAITITDLGLLIKAAYGIPALLMFVSFSIFEFIKGEKILMFLTSYIILLVTILFIWFCLYQNFEGFLRYFFSMIEFSIGHSSAMTLNPPNNWALLFVSGLFYILPYILNKETRFIYYILMLPIYIVLKYSFAREDHIIQILLLLTYFIFIVYLYVEKLHLITFLSYLVSILFFCLNINFVGYWESIPKFIRWNSGGITDFKRMIHYDDYLHELEFSSQYLTKSKVIKADIRESIGDNSIDFYPNETSYLYANNFSWKPRPVFQSYISYTPSLDKLNEQYYLSGTSSEYILWDHANKGLGDIDGRYLLSDEPLTIYQIFNKYTIIYSDENIVLFKTQNQNNFKSPIILENKEYPWNEWIEVPLVANGIIRARIHIDLSCWGTIKRSLYKEGHYTIDYLLDNDKIITYRLIPDNASSGVWISPHIIEIGTPLKSRLTKKIKLISYDGNVKPTVEIEWEFIEFTEQGTLFK